LPTNAFGFAPPEQRALPFTPACLGLRWQAQRDTAFARTEIFHFKLRFRPLESAVAAPALPAHSMTLRVHRSKSIHSANDRVAAG
jgi:hypothetical protein